MKKTMMKATFCTDSATHKIEILDTPVPQIQDPEDVIVRVTLASFCSSDMHVPNGDFGPITSDKPQMLGHEFCGVVEEVGSAVTKFKPGDAVMVMPAWWCGECPTCKAGNELVCEKAGNIGMMGLPGAFAEYIKVPWADRMMRKIPEGRTDRDFIFVTDILPTAHYGCRNAEVAEGDTVAIFGTGPIGMCAGLLAKKVFGAKTVICVDLLQNRLDLSREHGIADYTVNRSTENVVERIMEITGGKGVDRCIDTTTTEDAYNTAMMVTRLYGNVGGIGVRLTPMQNFLYVLMQTKSLKISAGVNQLAGYDVCWDLVEKNEIDVKWMGTHTSPLNDVVKAWDVFEKHEDGCIKYLLTPFEY